MVSILASAFSRDTNKRLGSSLIKHCCRSIYSGSPTHSHILARTRKFDVRVTHTCAETRRWFGIFGICKTFNLICCNDFFFTDDVCVLLRAGTHFKRCLGVARTACSMYAFKSITVFIDCFQAYKAPTSNWMCARHEMPGIDSAWFPKN